MKKPLIELTEAGIYCRAGDFYIDPHKPVPRALVTHGHADHARAGHSHVMASPQTLDIMAIRYGEDFCVTQQAGGRDSVQVGDVSVRFIPAGHVLGSCQIVIEGQGRRDIVSGDYSRVANAACAAFEPMPCDLFVTEATFALPVFRHPDPAGEIAQLLASVDAFPERAHIIGAYALGKAQRVIMLLRQAGYDAPIYIHGALHKLCDYHKDQGIALGELRSASLERAQARALRGAIILSPPSAFGTAWVQRFAEPVIAFASGWMQIRAHARRRGVELPLVISDHVDWPDLTRTIEEVDPQEVWITHGREEALMRWAALEGRKARPLHIAGYDEEPE